MVSRRRVVSSRMLLCTNCSARTVMAGKLHILCAALWRCCCLVHHSWAAPRPSL